MNYIQNLELSNSKLVFFNVNSNIILLNNRCCKRQRLFFLVYSKIITIFLNFQKYFNYLILKGFKPILKVFTM